MPTFIEISACITTPIAAVRQPGLSHGVPVGIVNLQANRSDRMVDDFGREMVFVINWIYLIHATSLTEWPLN